MKLGFRVGFMTALGVLVAYYLYQVAAFLLTNLVVNKIVQAILG